MAPRYFYIDAAGVQNGPVSQDSLLALLRSGAIPADALVWAEGEQPGSALQNAALLAAAKNAAPAIAQPVIAQPVNSQAESGPLEPRLPVWGLFWRSLVFGVGLLLIVPAPWVGLWFYRWLAQQVDFPRGRNLFLQTTLGDCWYIFIGLALPEFIGALFSQPDRGAALAPVVSFAVAALFSLLLTRWLAQSLRTSDGALSIAFKGDYLPYLGWMLLLSLSFVTIIGWAWVVKYQMRWICAQTTGTHRFAFVASGWDILWRSLLLFVGFSLLLPAPWAMRWFVNWFLGQIVATPAAQVA